METPNLGTEPQALTVSKKPIPVQVEFAKKDGVCETLEGAVSYARSDALLTRVHGEH